jgi:hypothetical protein
MKNKKIFREKILPTRFDGYYVSEDGRVFTEWHKKYIKGVKGCSSERGELREINQNPRGGSNPKDRYMSVNISLKDEMGRTTKQIKYYTHRLIAECFIENPENLTEIDHIDSNKLNNHAENLMWISRKGNMVKFNAKEFSIVDIMTGRTYAGINLTEWVRENWQWIQLRTRIKEPKDFTKNLLGAFRKGYSYGKIKRA